MKIHVLGCHGSDALLHDDRGPSPCHTCGFLVNDTVLLDAGTVGNKLPLDAQARIRHVLLSHLHFDHIKGLPTLADNLSDQGGPPVVIAGIPEVIQGLHDFVFNTHVYPDFFTIPISSPVLKASSLDQGKAYRFSGIDVMPILVNHTVPTTGFLIQDDTSAFVYSGDTFTTDDLWHQARQVRPLTAAFIECSYPNSMEDLARLSKHLTPTLLAHELGKLDRPDISVYAYHLKPVYKSQIAQELEALKIPNLRLLEEGQILFI